MILLDLRADPLQQWEDTLSILQDWRIFPEGSPIPDNITKPPFIKKVLVGVNKMDDKVDEEDFEVFLELSEIELPILGISTHTKRHLEALLERLYDIAHIIRVYTKAPGKEPDLTAPYVLPKASTLEDLALKVHKDFAKQLKYAKMWGADVFNGQMVQRDYVLQEGDVVEMHV